LLGTSYDLRQDFYVDALRAQGLDVVRPNEAETEDLQRLIYDELTRGIVRVESKVWLESLIARLVERGAIAVGLCCTELVLLIEEADAPVPVVDSTKAQVRTLLATLS
jgi:aspartate racemase